MELKHSLKIPAELQKCEINPLCKDVSAELIQEFP